jgi:hypothetical protein
MIELPPISLILNKSCLKGKPIKQKGRSQKFQGNVKNNTRGNENNFKHLLSKKILGFLLQYSDTENFHVLDLLEIESLADCFSVMKKVARQPEETITPLKIICNSIFTNRRNVILSKTIVRIN